MSGQQSENELKGKKNKRVGTRATRFFVNTYDISSIKCVTRKFQVVQHNGKEIYKKSVLLEKIGFVPIRPVDFVAVLVDVTV